MRLRLSDKVELVMRLWSSLMQPSELKWSLGRGDGCHICNIFAFFAVYLPENLGKEERMVIPKSFGVDGDVRWGEM